MGRSGFLIILFSLSMITARAQLSYDYRQVDSITYAATLSGSWDQLISLGKYALQNDMDYFYLRLRMGIAYFNKQNYRTASTHFRKAEAFNPEHGLTKDYLYHSYLYSGQDAEAACLAGKMTERMREVSGIDSKRNINFIYLETGPEFSNNLNDNALDRMPLGQNYRQQDLYGDSYYTHLGTRLYVHPRVNIFVGISNLLISKKASLQYAWNQPDSIVEYDWGFTKFFPENSRIETENYEYTLTQYNAYLNANIVLGKGWSLKPAINYISVNTRSIDIQNLSSVAADTAFYITDIDSGAYFNYDLIRFEMRPTVLTLNNIVLSLSLHKQISVFDLGLFGSWSDLNNSNQGQLGFSASYYPFGNLNFYGNTTLKVLMAEEETHPVFSQMIGMKIASFLWAEAFGVFGHIRGTNESDAFVVYNITDEINLKTGLNFTFVISPAVQLSLRYQYLQKQGYRVVAGSNSTTRIRVEELDYNSHSIIGGFKWIF